MSGPSAVVMISEGLVFATVLARHARRMKIRRRRPYCRARHIAAIRRFLAWYAKQ